MILFHVYNTHSHIQGADQYCIKMFDKAISYPTEVADAKERGIDLPYVTNPKWDGWIHFLRIPMTKDPWFPSGLLYKLTRKCKEIGIPFQVVDHRSRPEEQVPEFPKIDLRDYQQEAVQVSIKKGMGILDMPPRSGKTRTMLEIVRSLGYPAIWIAPTERICAQTKSVITDFFGPEFCFQLVGQAEEKLAVAARARIVICTTATAANLPQELYDTRQVLVIDEFHHAASKSYHSGIFPKCDHIFFRFGMTGTFFRSGNDEMALHAYLSETIYKITSDTLLKRGFLVPTQVVFVPVESPRLRGMPNNTFQGAHGKYGIQEHRDRNKLVVWSALYLANAGKKVLVLVGTKKQGRILVSMIQAMLPSDPRANYRAVEFLSTETPRPQQQKVIDAFLETDVVKVLIGTSLLGEGVDLPTADALVYARGERAEVSLTQNAYRVSTALPGKRKALIIDFADRHHKKLLAHSQDRLAIYFHEPTFQVSVLGSSQELPGWLSKNFLAQVERCNRLVE